MRLGDLTGGDEAATVTGFAIDHRKVAPGTVFGAFRGIRFNGEDFIAEAVARGAIAVIARPEVQVEGAVHIATDHPRTEFARVAARFFAPFPETTVAVTGTNGKTSTVEMVRQLWRMAGHHAASIGTLGVTTAGEMVSTGLTTPDVVTFLSNVAGLAREGVSHLAFEASSHGLSQYRTEGLPVRAAAFTNLSRDHLDYHKDMADYLTAKLRLFADVLDPDGTVVVWADDPHSERVIDIARMRGNPIITVGEHGDTIRLVSRAPTLLDQQLEIAFGGESYRVGLPLIGGYQAANALVAAGLVIATGGDPAQTFANLARLQPVRGRLERAAISAGGAPIYVDYAHTPDAIEAAIAALKPHVAGRLILVFGAGGDRDPGKRAPMGAAAAAGADLVIVTDDNPRGEDAATIRAAVMKGCPDATEIGDRRAAIMAAVAAAGPSDIVLIAGKGHEQGQIVGEMVLPFDDVSVAREAAA
ncbi:UDP-N-acetylmuramoyl-L-alanyl-D-glutamate--2,6-diaminopimelate ligase [Sphingomonas sp. BE123]|uniref:UDP-N-acetylmuramoyl-L-alanyl-D-glutamate--2, 6-diaminopimelate ligase n=1 Tax=Sphingomonas sp. BE123 TaxID=2817842 RepID=UPI002856F642|nr:UDP-N-acetylmuramoyl-L-alanyl-D-glutamate--2,6-diaminopimelate ligase [Sphingomonas sp. BE123]MDR6851470.1 UDP-N-acetylmuramoyl-L-alanyl-D-glutamate--2,6-diaminopimelate ligase [Sphingomonas sp. BE123]